MKFEIKKPIAFAYDVSDVAVIESEELCVVIDFNAEHQVRICNHVDYTSLLEMKNHVVHIEYTSACPATITKRVISINNTGSRFQSCGIFDAISLAQFFVTGYVNTVNLSDEFRDSFVLDVAGAVGIASLGLWMSQTQIGIQFFTFLNNNPLVNFLFSWAAPTAATVIAADQVFSTKDKIDYTELAAAFNSCQSSIDAEEDICKMDKNKSRKDMNRSEKIQDTKRFNATVKLKENSKIAKGQAGFVKCISKISVIKIYSMYTLRAKSPNLKLLSKVGFNY